MSIAYWWPLRRRQVQHTLRLPHFPDPEAVYVQRSYCLWLQKDLRRYKCSLFTYMVYMCVQDAAGCGV